MKHTLFILSFSLFVLCNNAKSNVNLLNDSVIKANEYYSEGNYEAAIRNYQYVVDSGYVASELYYNLGNAYYRYNNIPKAIVNFERAKLLDPFNKNIQHNLLLAQTKVIDEIEIVPEIFFKTILKEIITLFTVKTWTLLSIGFFIFSLLIFYIYIFTRRLSLKKISFWSSLFILFFSIDSYLFAYQQNNNLFNNKEAIIISPSITLKSSPDLISTDLFIIHEGTKVKVINNEGKWDEIKMGNGNTGWLKKSDLEII